MIDDHYNISTIYMYKLSNLAYLNVVLGQLWRYWSAHVGDEPGEGGDVGVSGAQKGGET